MTTQEWDSFVRLYREIWTAHADLATLKTILTTSEFAIQQNRPDRVAKTIPGWAARLEKSRRANFYAQYLAKCEAHIARAEEKRSDAILLELLSKDSPPSLLTRPPNN